MKAYKIIGLIFHILITATCAAAIILYSSRGGEQAYRDSLRITRYAADVFFRREFPPDEFASLNIRIHEWTHVALYCLLGAVSGLWVQRGRGYQTRANLLALTGVLCVSAGFAGEWLKRSVPDGHFYINGFLVNAASSLAGLFVCCFFALCIRAVSGNHFGKRR
ncbi:MAG: hypothetical protein LBH95_05580 [Oscillospiraceae bacterium]|jgi:VanZ family protein|nr:hypothetical protein [Oscillospiraceae bacterium]